MVSTIEKKALAYYGGVKSVPENIDYIWPIIQDNDLTYIKEKISNMELSFNSDEAEIRKLESKFASLIGSTYALAMNSGTSALFTAFLCLGLKSGDKVAAPSYTFPATIMPLVSMGVKIVFIDSEEDSPRMDIEDLKNKIDTSFSCIIVAHIDGIPTDMPEIMKIATANKCYVIEDCAQALGSKIDNHSVGIFGDVGIFSFQQKKLIAAGEGGMLVTSDKKLYEKAVLYSYLQKRSFEDVTDENLSIYAYTGLGFNFRIYPIAAALANCQLDRFEKILEMRVTSIKKIADALENCFGIKVVREKENEINSFYTLKILYLCEDILPIEKYNFLLNCEGVDIEQSLTIPLHLTEICKNNANQHFSNCFEISNLINCERYSKRLLRLKPYYNLSEQQIMGIVKAFEKVSAYLKSLKEETT